VTVPNGRYYMFTNQPGTLKFTTRFKVNALNWGLGSLFFNKGREVLKLDAKADTTYYLKLYLGQMTQLSYENGKAALAKCTKIIDTPPPLARTNNVISKT
jgi:hypothetical protein